MSASPGHNVLALDLGTQCGWAMRLKGGTIHSGSLNLSNKRFEGGGMRFLRFRSALNDFAAMDGGLERIAFEEVRRHIGTDAAHVYGGMLGTLSSWGEEYLVPYEAIPIGTWKKAIGLKGNASKEDVMLAIGDRGHNPRSQDEADAIGVLLCATGAG